MAHPVVVDDPDDPRIADFVGLTDVALRTRLEPVRGLFIAEGELVIRRVLRSGHTLRSVLVADTRLGALAGLLDGVDAPVFVAPLPLLEQVTGFHVHRGALAAVDRRPEPDPGHLLTTARRVAVVEDVNNTTNLGSLFRSAAGLGMDAVLLSPRCADPLYRRSVRVSMGEVFAVPWARLTPWPDALERLRDAGFQVLALTPAADAESLETLRLDPDERVAVLVGAEGPGLTPAARATADREVRIPMARGVDSLNVAVAAALSFFAVGRRPGHTPTP